MSNPNTVPRRPKGLVWLFFYVPGTLILWLNYYFPKDGEVWVSARRKGNPTMELLYSLAFWAVVTIVILMFVSGRANH
jgi:hypothetical protein